MGNCQAVETATAVSERPHSKSYRFYCKVSASEVVKFTFFGTCNEPNTNSATGSGEAPVNQTPTLNETTTVAQSTLGRTLAWEPHVASMESALKKSRNA
ncbi:hypothetical protein DY000_02046005 [Brassica cretica]|uniref:Uncharacterized protein n=1 Tax=Brassica cretica TaxID=69181 RepID=A0ABQ7ES92_BRACR|nr:hypothetical protein DY000_02046005 [Brassica cretica]